MSEARKDRGRGAVVLGLSASLRNARFGAGSEALETELRGLSSREELDEYLRSQAAIRLEDFVRAGRQEHLPFDELYRNLQKNRAARGLSNSEVALAAGLWGAAAMGAEIRHVGLAHHFPADHDPRDIDELKAKLVAADAILVSGPVYFGDRGSIAHSLIELIRNDAELRERLRGKVYGGIAVGAKRNGGQETSLIYQMLDMINLGLLAVGNDSDTTAQYGGTGMAGDVGTMPTDTYGLNTSIGVGRRVGRVASLFAAGRDVELTDRLTIAIWLVQDRDGRARRTVERLVQEAAIPNVEFRILDFTGSHIRRCIACDICPTDVGKDEEYRCIIKQRDDLFKERHLDLISSTDAILLAAYSPRDHRGVASVYQRFIERTRYLRRGDYVFSDRLVAPFIIEETGAHENLGTRAMTSLIRHHTVMHKPIMGLEHEGILLNEPEMLADLRRFAHWTEHTTRGRLELLRRDGRSKALYNPVGYVLSVEKDQELTVQQRREMTVLERRTRLMGEAAERIRTVEHNA